MAALEFLLEKEQDILTELFNVFRLIEDSRKVERNAAIKIQSWIRSIKIQKYIKHLHQCGVCIQKNYRAFAARKIYRNLVQKKMLDARKMFYNDMAKKIQATWRGYFVRKFKFDFYARKNYLNALIIKNEISRLQLQKVEERNKMEKQLCELKEKMNKEHFSNRKNHYLLSTRVCRGVYNSPTRPDLEKEFNLRIVQPLSAAERRQLTETKKRNYLKTATGIPKAGEIEKLIEKNKKLPPLENIKPQGPFRDPIDVQQQRCKKMQPSLRVATDYESVEKTRLQLRRDEWTKRIIDESFLPFTKTSYEYQPALHSSSSYGRLEYGTKHFRNDDKQKYIHEKPFQRTVSPIPLFEQIGKTY